METWFTSDNHFGHANIIKYCNRPFKSVAEMDEAMIANWNETVAPNDIVYHLGDFIFEKNESTRGQWILGRLNGKKRLIAGNHDRSKTRNLHGWDYVSDYEEITMGAQKIILAHFPFKTWNKVHHGAINLHGHSHGKMAGCQLQHDVGVDVWDFRPVNLETLVSAMAKLHAFEPVDHHGRDL